MCSCFILGVPELRHVVVFGVATAESAGIALEHGTRALSMPRGNCARTLGLPVVGMCPVATTRRVHTAQFMDSATELRYKRNAIREMT